MAKFYKTNWKEEEIEDKMAYPEDMAMVSV